MCVGLMSFDILKPWSRLVKQGYKQAAFLVLPSWGACLVL